MQTLSKNTILIYLFKQLDDISMVIAYDIMIMYVYLTILSMANVTVMAISKLKYVSPLI